MGGESEKGKSVIGKDFHLRRGAFQGTEGEVGGGLKFEKEILLSNRGIKKPILFFFESRRRDSELSEEQSHIFSIILQ